MDNIVEYLIKSGIALSVFYLFYWLLMRKSTHFGLNRLTLAASLLASLVLPIFKIDLSPEAVVSSIPVMSIDLANVVRVVSRPQPAWGVREIVLLIYFSGLLITLGRLLYQSAYIHAISKMSVTITRGNYTIVLVEKDITPFAYFSKIFIPASKIEESSFESILEHEKSHLGQYHYLDLFLIEIITIIQWFNPVVWLYERSVKEVHEFLADEEVLKRGVSRGNYQALLVNQALGGPVFTISHQFNQSLILKRILMMTKMKTPQWTKVKALLFIPLTAGLLMAFSNPEPLVNPVVAKVESIKQHLADAGKIAGDASSQNLANAEKGSLTIKGKVIDGSTSKPIKGVSIMIQGTTKGTISDENGAFTIKENGPSILIIFSHISYTTTIYDFKTDSSVIIQMYKGAQDLNKITITYLTGEQNTEIKPFPYVLVDGVPTDEETFNAISFLMIESVDVLKKEDAIALYGEKGKNGVLIVVTKKGSDKEEIKGSLSPKNENKAVFTVTEGLPSFPGGENERVRFLSDNLRVPAYGVKEGLEGTVYVQFIVQADGSITDARILRGLGKSYDDEVLRVIGLMPKWIPGTQNGEAVAGRCNMPVKFEKK